MSKLLGPAAIADLQRALTISRDGDVVIRVSGQHSELTSAGVIAQLDKFFAHYGITASVEMGTTSPAIVHREGHARHIDPTAVYTISGDAKAVLERALETERTGKEPGGEVRGR